MEIYRDRSTKSLFINQGAYARRTIDKYGMSDANPVSVPADPNNILRPVENDDDCLDNVPYRELVGSLTYLAIISRPDIAFATSNVIFQNMENNEADGLHQPQVANQVPAVNPVLVPNDMLQLQNMIREMQAHIELQAQQLRRQQELLAEQQQRRQAEEQQRQQAEEQQRQQRQQQQRQQGQQQQRQQRQQQQRQQGQQQRRQQLQQQQRQQGPLQRQNQEPAPQGGADALQQRDDDAASVSGVSNAIAIAMR
ncbi:unnamed protein product [Trichogramma brassicae]|uniref:Reverse transcriptase Ty1/copia-type domain-containing protein n=1 Tax=Trichogramma brassicae TaxID=86971 RepID=A0A6H5IDR7_9HYME|nr:unnamed protein product [Trichogramma brassicae]